MPGELEISGARVAGESEFRWKEACGCQAGAEKIQACADQTSVKRLVAGPWGRVPGNGCGSGHEPGDATWGGSNGKLSEHNAAGSPIIFGPQSHTHRGLIEGDELSCETNPRGGLAVLRRDLITREILAKTRLGGRRKILSHRRQPQIVNILWAKRCQRLICQAEEFASSVIRQ